MRRKCGGQPSVMPGVEQRWQLPFWQVLSDLAAQGLNKGQCSDAIGVARSSLYTILADNPGKDPFELKGPSAVVSAWLSDTGEPFGAACKRMAEEGMTATAAAREFGFSSPVNMFRAMRDRGISVEFPRRTASYVSYVPGREAASKWLAQGPNRRQSWHPSEAEARKAVEAQKIA